jgi:ABC-type lipoprotein release transport system permease subunit
VAVRDGRLLLGAAGRSFTVLERLPPDTAMVSHDLVLLNWHDAGEVLGIPPGFASDLAVGVYHPQEAEVLVPEIAAALPWPVTITTRTEAEAAYSGPSFRRGSLALLAFSPGLLAMLLLVALTIRERVSRKEEIGLFRAIGWTTADLLRLHLVRALLIAVPGVLAGMVAAYGLVFRQGISWPSRILLGWPRPAPQLFLDPSGALQVLASIGALILLPYLAAALAPVLWAGLSDPRDLLEKGR